MKALKRYVIESNPLDNAGYFIEEKSNGEWVKWEDLEKARQQLKKKCSQILTRYQIQEVIDEVLK